MLNISKNNIRDNIDFPKYASFRFVNESIVKRVFIRILGVFFGVFLIVLFLPWTQNVQSRGYVTALKPEQRPQTIQSVINGRIEKWFVQEGDYVSKGDTILFISDINDNFFDPQLLDRTISQIDAKKSTVGAYNQKVSALENQITALLETSSLKVEQAKNRLEQSKLLLISDSINFEARKIDYEVAINQFERMKELYKEGLKSLTEFEARKMALQRAQADKIAAENKLLASKNEVLNARVELISIPAQFRNAIAKSEADKSSAFSSMFTSEAEVTKLENQLENFSIRRGMYFITSPVNGHITKAIQAGIGEAVMQGQQIVSLMPANIELAVEMYVRPLDLPLLVKGQPVRIQFDGWPAIVFSGWPNTSYGTYGGRIFAMDNFISENGLYRVLVKPDFEDYPWPDALRVGAGTYNMLLLKDVPIWYELWRQLNGFPPDYYKPQYILDRGKDSKK